MGVYSRKIQISLVEKLKLRVNQSILYSRKFIYTSSNIDFTCRIFILCGFKG